MLNYIWIGLILVGLFVAVGNDITDEVRNTYRNGEVLEATLQVQKSPSELRGSWEGELLVPMGTFNAFYRGARTDSDVRQHASISEGMDSVRAILIPVSDATPRWWREMARSGASKERLTGSVVGLQFNEDRTLARVRFTLEPIRFIKLKAVTAASLDYAGTAVTIAIGLIGIMALWLGVMKVAEEAGLLLVLTRALTPVTKRLFPDVPPDHPAVGAIIMNIAANMLGLSNAATPMGLKAMEELNKLNPKVGTATNAMITFLAINTGGLILIPATAIAVRAAAGSSNPGIIIGTSIVGAGAATIVGVVASKVLQRLPGYKKAMEVSHE
ncbi:MAG TPA: nucleoside recognition domain-containing protein [Bacteroidota bacterium]|nr:nucleoside recognition domain-containing protein [Bacteroidota bacterium]